MAHPFLLRRLYKIPAALALGVTLVGTCRAELRPRVTPDHVLVVTNSRSPDSVAIGDYYAQKRKLPPANTLRITCPDLEECSATEYREQILGPIKAWLGLRGRDVDYIVLTKGVPIRLSDGEQAGFSVDSVLAMMDWTLLKTRTENPFYAKHERFSHRKFKMYLVTRFDGYTRGDCLHLITNALYARPTDGPFLLYQGTGHENGGYKPVNDAMREAHALLTAKAMRSVLNSSGTFAGGMKDLMGYFSWGSNDQHYDKKAYNSLGFVPGAIAETAVSTSARTFSNPAASGQSLIGDLVAQGVTGCKGYVSEPYADAIAHADVLFDRYTDGFNLAESFYMASYWTYWKDIVIGDPLCAPYASAK